MKKVLALLPTLLALTACVTDNTVYMQNSKHDNCDSLQLGMSFDEVVKILGDQTARKSVTRGSDGSAIEMYRWDTGTMILFENKKIYSVSRCG